MGHLTFASESIRRKVVKRSARAMKRKELTFRQRWLSHHFAKHVEKGLTPKLEVQFVSEEIGDGVFASEDIPKGAFIGEYTGVVRKRRGRSDRKNSYTFEYAIGDWPRNPFIIDAKDDGNICRFINHSETPNLESLAIYVSGVMHIILVSLEPISKGNQLSYHYGENYWKKRSSQLKQELPSRAPSQK